MFYENLKKLCDEHKTTPTAVAKIVGMSSAAPVYWKRGSIPKSNTLQKIADYFGVTTDALLTSRQPESRLHTEQGEKIAVLASVGAGIPMEAINTFDADDPDSWEEISKIDAEKNQYFALRIRGDSMEPMIRHGDIVIVRVQDHYDDGDIVIALINGDEGVCKLLEYRNNGISLISINAAKYQPMNFTNEQIENLPVRIMGRCVERRSKL